MKTLRDFLFKKICLDHSFFFFLIILISIQIFSNFSCESYHRTVAASCSTELSLDRNPDQIKAYFTYYSRIYASSDCSFKP